MVKTIKFFEKVRSKTPLVHNITNYVTVNDVANSILAVGGAPLMADDIDEVNDIVAISSALVINIGTLSRRTMESMVEAGKKANQLNLPVILDPVGVGASSLRNEIVEILLREVKFSVIKGNMSEITSLYEKSHNSGGVDVSPEDLITEDNIQSKVRFVKSVSKKLSSVVCVTGAIDIVTDGTRVTLIKNGDEKMACITGTGCMTAGILGACCGVEKDYYKASVHGITLMGMAGEYAASISRGVGSMRTNLIDGLYLVSRNIQKIEVKTEELGDYLRLYLVTDETWATGDKLLEDIEKSLKAGVSCVQYRHKGNSENIDKIHVEKMRNLALKYEIPFIINDHVHLVDEFNADGLHIGQDDMSISQAREMIGVNKLIGVSVSNVNEAIEAELNGADYLGVGAIFTTSSKLDANAVSIDELKNITASVNIPIVAIGGISKDNIGKLEGTNASGVAVISAILAQEDIELEAKYLNEKTIAIF